jgi:urease accessory protein UreH
MTGTTYDGALELVVRGRSWRRVQRPPLSLTVLEKPDTLWAMPTDQSGGARGGDQLNTEVLVREGARLEWLPPASALYFPSADRAQICQIRTRIGVDSGSRLDFLPKVSIPCRGARVDQEVVIETSSGAELLYWDGWSDGRTASGERGQFSTLANRLEFHVDSRLVFQERWTVEGGSRGVPDPAGLQGACQWWLGLAVGARSKEELSARVTRWKSLGETAECGELADGIWLARALLSRPRG